MKTLSLLALLTLNAHAENIITLGDSLTFAYEAEFCFQLDLSVIGQGVIGDGFDSDQVKNWIEILHEDRNSHFNLGTREDIDIILPTSTFPFLTTETLHFRREYNWAVPGFKIDQLRRFLTRESTVLTLLSESPQFAILEQALILSDFNEATDFAIADLENQITNDADRLVLFIGGNDVDDVYQTVYNNQDPGTFIDDFIADTNAILNIIQTLNPTLPIVLVNVPHIGITPEVKSSVGTNVAATERATAFIRDLNNRLRTITQTRNLGYADIFTATLPILKDRPLGVYGIPFTNSGSTTGDLDFVWLNGTLSTNFHPNTSAQALIANEIICAFNQGYQADIPPLTAVEILSDLLNKTPTQIDMRFRTWADAYSLPSYDLASDRDKDGISAALEFALGLNPRYNDAHKITFQPVTFNNTPHLEIKYPLRLPGSNNVTVIPESSTDLSLGFTPFTSIPTLEADGYAHARIPITNGKGFLRLLPVSFNQ